jgi:hypothetical protein
MGSRPGIFMVRTRNSLRRAFAVHEQRKRISKTEIRSRVKTGSLRLARRRTWRFRESM